MKSPAESCKIVSLKEETQTLRIASFASIRIVSLVYNNSSTVYNINNVLAF